MTEKAINHLILGSIVNAALIVLLVNASINGNDKSIILVIVFYPALILLNLIP